MLAASTFAWGARMTVHRWSGRETRALRLALRQSSRGFAARLGVNERTVTNWEARGEKICPRPEMQEALDTALRRASDEAKSRFQLLLHMKQPTADDGGAATEQEMTIVPTRRDVCGYLGAGLAVGLGRVAVPRVAQALAVTQQADAGDPDTPALDDLHALVKHYKQTFRVAPRQHCMTNWSAFAFTPVRCSIVLPPPAGDLIWR
jgi:hypothetical protein